ncbi:hypothetical protein ABVN23_10375 [Pseudomonas fluorescens]|uniref:hypothetical protein n=1 Tax=Pseudomonas fluorescens TaxID=294 RepID=UPI003F98DF5E
MDILPSELIDFFDRTTREYTHLHKPDWLLSEVSDSAWRVDNKNDLRLVGGKQKGGTILRWDRDLPGGLWSDDQYSTLLEQCKQIVIWAHDGVIGLSGNSLRTIDGFHNYLYWFVEFLIIRLGGEFRSEGFKVVGIDDVVDFLEVFELGGVCGTSHLIERWESYLYDQAGIEPSNIPETVKYLRANNAYCAKGKLKSSFVGAALKIRSRRVRVLSKFVKYLTRYESCTPVREFSEGSAIAVNYARWFIVMSRTLAYLPEFSSVELACTESVAQAVRPFRFRPDNRTATLPSVVARKLLGSCCTWMLDVYPKLINFVKLIEQRMTASPKVEAGLTKRISMIEADFIIDPSLLEIVEKWRRTPHGPTLFETSQSNMTSTYILLRLHNAVCYTFIGMLGCCRRREVTELPSLRTDDKTNKIQVSIRKTGIDNSRLGLDKPIPKIAIDCLVSLGDLKSICKGIIASDDPLVDKLAFFSFGLRGLAPLDSAAVNGLLTEISLIFDLLDDDNEVWLIRSHELRRYFAMSFFHHGGNENTLPALTWFMGHNNIEKTWQYIKESLTGKELSASEASMATSAVYSEDQTENVKILRSTVLKYFGCTSMGMLSKDEVQEYLEMMSERGMYSARPVQIQCGRQKVFTVLISISEEISNATA